MLKFLGVFVAMFVFDFVWTECVKAVNEKHAFKAANLGSATWALQGLVTIAYVAEPWLIVACVLGGWSGTYLAVKRASRV